MAERENGPGPGRFSGSGLPASAGFLAFLIAVSAVAAVTVLWRGETHGPALHWDSVNYLAVARNLLAGDGFRNYDGSFYGLWPPLYPLALAAATLGVFDPLEVALPFGAVVFGLTVFITGRFLERRLRSRFLALWAPVVLALAAPLGDLAWWALSGPLFLLLATLALVRADDFRAEGRTSSLLAAAAFTALAWQTRYVGAALAPVVVLIVFLAPAPSRLRRFGRAALVALIAAAPTGLWLLRVSQGPLGLGAQRQVVDDRFGEALAQIGAGLLGWAEFEVTAFPIPWSGFAAATLFGAVSVLFFRRARGPDLAARLRPAAAFAGFALAYALLLSVAVALGFTWQGVQTRFLAPLYLPILVAATLALEVGLRRFREGAFGRGRAALPAAAAAALTLGAAAQADSSLRAIGRANSEYASAGLAGLPWKASRTVRYFRENRPEGATYSNLPILLYLHSDGRGDFRSLPPTAPSPPPFAGRVPPGLSPREHLRRWVETAPEGASVVWIADSASPAFFAYGRPGLIESPGLSRVVEFPDGGVWKVSRPPPAEAGTSRYRDAYESISSGAAGEPIARSGFDLYRWEESPPRQTGDSDAGDSNPGSGTAEAEPAAVFLVYLREPCSRSETRGEFRLRFYAGGSESGGPPGPGGREFEEGTFRFEEHGIQREGRCLAIAPLPPGAGGGVRIEQRDATGRPLWVADAHLDRERFREAYAEIVAGGFGPPVGRSTFDLYRRGRTLAYLREPCPPEAVGQRFFLHLYRPPAGRPDAEPGRPVFENRDFDFPRHGAVFDDRCLALVELPADGVSRIRTGQWVSGRGESWSLEAPSPEADAETAEQSAR